MRRWPNFVAATCRWQVCSIWLGCWTTALLLHQSHDKLARVFAPKVRGAWNLHCATQDDDLDHFVLFSSVSAVLGSAGQANHAAANAFMDALSGYRRSRGQPGLSINWGPWSGIGAAAARGVDKRGDLAGVGMITPEEGITLLEHLLGTEHPQIAGVRLDVDKLPPRWKELPVFETLLATASQTASGRNGDSPFRKKYAATPATQKRIRLLGHLQTLVAATLGIKDPKSIPPDEALSDLGLDSLASLELCNNIEESLSTTLPSTLIFDYPTLNALAGYFLQVLEKKGDRAEQSAQVVHPPSAETKPSETAADAEACGHTAGPAQHDSLGGVVDTSRILRGIQELSQELDYWNEV